MSDIEIKDELYMYNTRCPQHPHVPALTTLLHEVCQGDQTRFDLACLLVNAFVDEDRKCRDQNKPD